jgi:hypothetical protein
MKTTTSNYNTYNALLNKKPVFIVEIGGLTTKFVSGKFKNIASYTTKKSLVSISGSIPPIDIYQPEITSGTFTVKILDKNSEFVSILNSNVVIAQSLTIKSGFEELDYADFLTITPTGTVVYSIKLNDNKIVWELQARDSFFNLVTSTLNGILITSSYGENSTLSANLNAGVTASLSITDSTNYAQQADIANGINADNRVITCVKIDNEIIQYSTTGVGVLSTLTRGTGNTTDANHNAGATVNRGLGFKCDPLRTMLHLLMTSNGGTNGKYDLDNNGGIVASNYAGISNNGFTDPITTDEINVENIERLGWRLFHIDEYNANGFVYVFYDNTSNVLNFIQQTLLSQYGLFLKVINNKIEVDSCDYVYFVENFSADDTLTSSNVIDIEDIELTDIQEAHGSTRINYNFNHGTDSYISGTSQIVKYFNGQYSTSYGIINTKVIGHHGLISGVDADQAAKMIMYRFSFFLDVMSKQTLSVYHKQLPLEPGDKVSLNWTNFPSIDSGSRGLSSIKTLIVGQEFNWSDEQFSLLYNSLIFDIPGTIRRALTNDVYYTINKVVENSITDKSLSVSADETATTEAADAYYDNSGTAYQADLIIFFIRITPPAFGGGSDSEILDLKISWLNSSPTIQNSDHRPYIHFNPQSSMAFTFPLFLYGKSSSADTPDRVKVDWVSTTATGGEVPTVEFVGVWFVKWNQTIS